MSNAGCRASHLDSPKVTAGLRLLPVPVLSLAAWRATVGFLYGRDPRVSFACSDCHDLRSLAVCLVFSLSSGLPRLDEGNVDIGRYLQWKLLSLARGLLLADIVHCCKLFITLLAWASIITL